MKTVINVPYQPLASKNSMNRRAGYRGTPSIRYGLVREARRWRDAVRDAVKGYRGVYGAKAHVTFQIVSNGKARGDTANFVDLGLDGLATGLGLTSDHKLDVHALPRVVEPVGESYIRITLENPPTNFIEEDFDDA